MAYKMVIPTLVCRGRRDEAACVAETSDTTCLWTTATNGDSTCDVNMAGPLLQGDKI